MKERDENEMKSLISCLNKQNEISKKRSRISYHAYIFLLKYNYSNHSLFDRMVIIQYLNSSFLLYSTMSNLERETSLI
jgi:hypothetical protein